MGFPQELKPELSTLSLRELYEQSILDGVDILLEEQLLSAKASPFKGVFSQIVNAYKTQTSIKNKINMASEPSLYPPNCQPKLFIFGEPNQQYLLELGINRNHFYHSGVFLNEQSWECFNDLYQAPKVNGLPSCHIQLYSDGCHFSAFLIELIRRYWYIHNEITYCWDDQSAMWFMKELSAYNDKVEFYQMIMN